jgi:hypothetical protein
MAKTKLGEEVMEWSAASKEELKTDLGKLTKLPIDVLRAVAVKVAKNYPACNPYELAAVEAEQQGAQNPQDLADGISAFAYLWDDGEGESAEAIASDFVSMGLLSKDAVSILLDLWASAEPFRATAKVISKYTQIGSPLYVVLRGTVDIRLRFHKTFDEFLSGKLPTELVGTQQVIMANLTLKQPDGGEVTTSFLMDEDDLRYMKKFVRNMERELELSKGLHRP